MTSIVFGAIGGSATLAHASIYSPIFNQKKDPRKVIVDRILFSIFIGGGIGGYLGNRVRKNPRYLMPFNLTAVAQAVVVGTKVVGLFHK